ncbi:hypothetical protein IFM89_019596 [Coptis chinensis]|uniref:RING-type E3 ubiquitin transferase n=1 Tax=Coptis chinensis TaxID=261450 RepID=A0A835M5H9_9MAGN|nr:hypothetical protein IFM89_019596 [Coptis chinensis]
MSTDEVPVQYSVKFGKHTTLSCDQDRVENVNDSCVIIKVSITQVDQCTTIDGDQIGLGVIDGPFVINSVRLRFSFLRKSKVGQFIPGLWSVLESYPNKESSLIQQHISKTCEDVANALQRIKPREFVIEIPVEVTRTVILDEIDDEEEFEQSLLEVIDEASGNKLVPAAPSSVEALKSKKIDKHDSKRTACAVCLDEYLIGVYVTEMPCSHMYHKHCIESWLRTTNTCPLCRCGLPTAVS